MRGRGRKPSWTKQERDQVLALAQEGASQREIAEAVFSDSRYRGRVERLLRAEEAASNASPPPRDGGAGEAAVHADALDRIRPEVVIVSSDEIPAKDDVIDKYKERATVFSTRDYGTLTVRMHTGGDIQIFDRTGRELTRLWDRAA